jgi:hypothetical protein
VFQKCKSNYNSCSDGLTSRVWETLPRGSKDLGISPYRLNLKAEVDPFPKYCGFILETRTPDKIQINTIEHCVTSPLYSVTMFELWRKDTIILTPLKLETLFGKIFIHFDTNGCEISGQVLQTQAFGPHVSQQYGNRPKAILQSQNMA